MAQRNKRSRNRGSSGNNRNLSNSFLEKNSKKQGVITTNSGLQYNIVDKGTGESPPKHANITMHQRCMLINGTPIIDSYKENQPVEVPVSELIEGLQEGILLMNKGSRFKFFLPPNLAWGEKGSSSKIPPNSVLIFDVRLIDFW